MVVKGTLMCPLLAMATTTKVVECQRELCAWWDEELEQCAIRSLLDIETDVEG